MADKITDFALPLQCASCRKVHLASQRVYTKLRDFDGANIHVCPHCRGIPKDGPKDKLLDGYWLMQLPSMRHMKSLEDWKMQAACDPVQFPVPKRERPRAEVVKREPVAVILDCGCSATECECWRKAMEG